MSPWAWTRKVQPKEMKGGIEEMDKNTKQRLEGYLELLKEIALKTSNEQTAVALLHEISKDRRVEQMKQERENKADEPATDKQKVFMNNLGIEYSEEITKKEASALIEEQVGG